MRRKSSKLKVQSSKEVPSAKLQNAGEPLRHFLDPGIWSLFGTLNFELGAWAMSASIRHRPQN
jgi:hypothetical protein